MLLLLLLVRYLNGSCSHCYCITFTTRKHIQQSNYHQLSCFSIFPTARTLIDDDCFAFAVSFCLHCTHHLVSHSRSQVNLVVVLTVSATLYADAVSESDKFWSPIRRKLEWEEICPVRIITRHEWPQNTKRRVTQPQQLINTLKLWRDILLNAVSPHNEYKRRRAL